MSSFDQLPAYLSDALRRGRAIPLLVDYRPPEIADHSLTVIGLIDGASFEGVLLSDHERSDEFVRLQVPGCETAQIPAIETDSADARAVHELWARWHGGVRDGYLQFTRSIATAMALASLDAALQSATAVGAQTADQVPASPKRKSKPPARKTPPGRTGRTARSKGKGRG
ncbi:MAG: hypothetical protein VX836_12460 [Pseudomonadota bacterium]|nr:hypothetical protein [Pseudomonadota bacterium]